MPERTGYSKAGCLLTCPRTLPLTYRSRLVGTTGPTHGSKGERAQVSTGVSGEQPPCLGDHSALCNSHSQRSSRCISLCDLLHFCFGPNVFRVTFLKFYLWSLGSSGLILVLRKQSAAYEKLQTYDFRKCRAINNKRIFKEFSIYVTFRIIKAT